MLFFMLLLMQLPNSHGHDHGPEQGLDPQVGRMINESQELGANFRQIIEQPGDATHWSAMADQYAQLSLPLHAAAFYEKALSVKTDHAAAKEGLAKVGERINQLQTRLAELEADLSAGAEPRKYNSKAAVLFHMGRNQDAFRVLAEAKQLYPGNREIVALETTFGQGWALRRAAIIHLDRLIKSATAKADRELALDTLGQIVYIGLGHAHVEDYLKGLKTAFPDLDLEQIRQIVSLSRQTKS